MEIFRKDDGHKTCLHDNGFTLTHIVHMNVGYPGLWVCNHLCGFYLNFDPSEFPNGVAYVKETPEGKSLTFVSSKRG